MPADLLTRIPEPLTMTTDERACFERLREWERRFDGLLAMFERTRPYPTMPPELQSEARVAYTALKADLKIELARLNNFYKKRSQAETRWYYSTVQRAALGLLARPNSRPERWFNYLHDYGDEFSVALITMRRHFGLLGQH
jgi:hypothetical protein